MYFIIIPKGIKGIPFILFFVGIIMAIASYMDGLNYEKELGSIVNVSQVNYDEVPEDTKFYVFDNVKIVDSEPESPLSFQYYCLGQFKDGESKTHYVRITTFPADENYEKLVNNIDYTGNVIGDVNLSGTYTEYIPNNASGSRHVNYNPSELDNEKLEITLRCASTDMNYGETQNALLTQKRTKSYVISVVSLVVAVLSAIGFFALVKAGK